MTDTAERIAKLAERLDPPFEQRPYLNSPEAEAYLAWAKRYNRFNASLAIATPGARLGALVDLFDFALAPRMYRYRIETHEDGRAAAFIWQAGSAPPTWAEKHPTAAAALLAAMEEVEI